MKDFREEVAPLRELYSELCVMTPAEGGTSVDKILYECQGLLKQTGIELMDCPFDITLKLCVCRKLPNGGKHNVWQVPLPMSQISKHVQNTPYEWQTWIGLLPNTVELNLHNSDQYFT